jgi:hypothetical protein
MLRLLLITIVFLSGCATPPRPIPPELQYVAPVDQEGSLATLVGSREEGIYEEPTTVYVLTVDGKRVMSGPHGWHTALPIEPGPHTIAVAFQSGSFHTQVDLQMEAVAGSKYQIKFSTDAKPFGTITYCDLWIIDIITQKPVSGIGCGNIENPYER